MGQTTDEQKAALRIKQKLLRRQYTAVERCIWDSAIACALLALPQYMQMSVLLTYISAAQEVSTTIPIAHALSLGKPVAVPRWGNGSMEFCAFTDYRDLQKDGMGLMQPAPDAPAADGTVGAVCLVPALAVDTRGYRLGYGGGYYDRFLAGFNGFSVTLAYDNMVMEKLPVGQYDLPVDCIVTPTRVIYT